MLISLKRLINLIFMFIKSNKNEIPFRTKNSSTKGEEDGKNEEEKALGTQRALTN